MGAQLLSVTAKALLLMVVELLPKSAIVVPRLSRETTVPELPLPTGTVPNWRADALA